MTLMLFKESSLIRGGMKTEGLIFALLFMIQIHMGQIGWDKTGVIYDMDFFIYFLYFIIYACCDYNASLCGQSIKFRKLKG